MNADEMQDDETNDDETRKPTRAPGDEVFGDTQVEKHVVEDLPEALTSASIGDWTNPPEVQTKTITIRGRLVTIKEMTGAERDMYEAEGLELGASTSERLVNFRSRLLCWVIVDPFTLEPLFQGRSETFAKWPVHEIEPAVDIAMDLNGMHENASKEIVGN